VKGAAFLTLTLGFIIAVILCCSSLSFSFAQTTNAPSGDIKSTSGGTLDVKLESTPNPIRSSQETNYKVTFLQKDTDTVQVHIDYDFIILKNNNTEVFKASQQTGQPLLHTAEGIVTIPFTLEEDGNYTIRVPVMGINFVPMATEYADFPVKIE
jgi:ABC-type antimicrobial peptide transport system permease subunit